MQFQPGVKYITRQRESRHSLQVLVVKGMSEDTACAVVGKKVILLLCLIIQVKKTKGKVLINCARETGACPLGDSSAPPLQGHNPHLGTPPDDALFTQEDPRSLMPLGSASFCFFLRVSLLSPLESQC